LNSATARIGLVQPVISQETRWDRLENRPPLLASMDRLIDRAAAGSPDLIVLPEGALPGLVRYEGDLAGFSTGAVVRTGIPLLFGSIDRDDEQRVYNVAVRIGIDGSVDQYRKRRLVPFAEHTPWPFRYTPADGWVQFSPGGEPALMPVEGGKSFAVMICLEDTYPDLAREYARAGADFLVSLVNTENFRGTNQGLVHLRRARLTSIASGLPMLRAANSGISCSIDSRGRILSSLPPDREQGVTIDVSVVRSGTVYQSLGDGGVFLILLALSAVRLVWPGTEARTRRRRHGRRRRSARLASPVRAG
jgi:apolipoprotein N-acyltransferase